MADPQNPNQIDIGLSLTGQTEMTALVKAIGDLSAHVQTIHSSLSSEMTNRIDKSAITDSGIWTPAGASLDPRAAQDRLEQRRREQGYTPDQEATTREIPTSGGSSSGTQTEQVIDEAAAKQKLWTQGGRFGRLVDKALVKAWPDSYERDMEKAIEKGNQVRTPAPAPETDNRMEEEEFGQAPPFGGGPGGPSRPPTDEDGFDPNAPAWMHTVQRTGVEAPITLPRLGELNPQDYMRMAARLPFRLAERSQVKAQTRVDEATTPGEVQVAEQAKAGAGLFTGRVAAGLGQAAEWMPMAHTIGTKLGMGNAQGVMGLNLNPRQMLAQQEGRGFSGGGATMQDLPGGVGGLVPDWANLNLPAPIRAIATEAGREAIKEEVERARLRFRNPGLTDEEAQSIEGVMEERGINREGRGVYSDRFRRGVSRLVSARAERTRAGDDQDLNAADPSLVVDLVQKATQHGTQNLEGFIESLESVPEAATAAGVSLNEMLDHMNQMGEFFANEAGGTHAGGAQFAQQFSATTGVPAPVAQQMLQNPMVQGQLALLSGRPAELQGTLPGGTLTKGIYEAIDRTEAAYRGSTADATVKGLGGEEVVLPGRIGDLAREAHELETTPDELSRVKRGRKRAEKLASLQDSLSTYQSMGEDADSRDDSTTKRALRGKADPNDGIFTQGDIEAGLKQQFRGAANKKAIEEALYETKDGKKVQRSIAGQSSRIQEFIAEKTGKETAKELAQPKVQVEFVGAAADIFRVKDDRKKNQDLARRAKSAANAPFAEPAAPAHRRMPESRYYGGPVG